MLELVVNKMMLTTYFLLLITQKNPKFRASDFKFYYVRIIL